MTETKKLIEKLNEAEHILEVTDDKFGEIIYLAWMSFKGEETDPDKLSDLANEFIELIRKNIEDSRGTLL